MSLTETTINIPVSHMANVFGQFDAYMKKIERAFEVAQDRRIVDGRFKIFAIYHGSSPHRAMMGQPRMSVANCITQPRILK